MPQQELRLTITAQNLTQPQFEQIQASLAATDARIGRVNARMVESGAASDAAAASVNKHASTYLRLGVAMGLVGGAVDALGVKSATSLDTAEHHVMALTNAIGTSVNQISLGKLEAQIRSLSDETGVSTTKITEGFYSVASADLSAAKSMEVLRDGSKFAAASQTEQSVALGLLTSVTKAYGLSLPQIKQYQDDITQAVKLGTMEARDYAPALAQNIPLAHQLGVNLKELGAIYIVLTNNGLSAAQAGVEVGNTLTKLLNPTYQQIQAITTLGGSMKDFKVVNGDVIGTLTHLNDLITNAVPNVRALENAHGDLTRRQAVFVEQMKNSNSEVARLFGGNTQAMRLFFALMANGGDQARAALKGMQNDTGATDKAFQTMADSAEMQFKRMSVAFDQASQALGKSLLPQLKGISGVLGPAADSTGAFLRQHQEMTALLGDSVIAVGGLTAAYYANSLVISPLVSATGTMIGALGTVKTGALAARDAMVAMDVVEVGAIGTMTALSGAIFVVASAFIAAKEAHDHFISAANEKSLTQGQKEIKQAFDEGNLTLKQAQTELSNLGRLAAITHTPLATLTTDQLTASKAAYDHAHGIIALNDAINILGKNNVGGFGGSIVAQQTALPKASQGLGGGPTPFDVTKVITYAEQEINRLAKKIIDDGEMYGKHSSEVEKDRLALASNIATYQKYNGELTKLTDTSGKLRDTQTQAEKEYAAAQQKYQDALVQGAVDVAKFGHVLPAHAQALDQAKTKALAMSDAMNSLQGKVTHAASALDILNAAALKGQALPAMYDAAAEAQKKLADKSMKLADVFAEVERRAGDYSAYLGQFNKRLQDTLTNAEGRLAFDQSPKGDKSRIGADKEAVTAAQKNIDAWSSSVSDATGAAKGFSFVLQEQQSKLQDAVSTAEGKLVADQNAGASHKTILADEQAVRSANARLNAFNKELSDLTPSMTHLESAAEKAAKALQKIEDALKKPGAEGAEAANRAGQYNATFGTGKGSLDPRNFASEGDWEKALQKANDAFWKTHAFVGGEITTKGAGALSVLRHDPTALAGESKADLKTIGVTVAALLQDPTILGYLEKESPKQLQAIGVSPSQIVDAETAKRQKALSDAEAKRDLDILQGHTSALAADKEKITKASEALDAWTGVVTSSANQVKTYAGPKDFLGTHFASVGNAAATPPSIAATVSGGGFAATVPGVISGGKALEGAFANLVTAGMANVKSQEVQTHANYQIAKNTGDTATEFSILDTAFLAGKTSLDGLPITLDGVVQAYNENQATVLATTQRLIAFDKATGNTADALTQTQALYLQGNASLTELDQAYNDNQVTVAKNTQQMQAFYASTGQFGQLLTSISSGISQDANDSQAKVTLDILTGNTAAFKSDTDAAIAHRQAQEALTSATWDSTYATANAATQSQMRQSLASPMVSQQSTVQGLASGVFNAQLGVIAARSAVMVAEMQAEVTATNDLAGIIQAQSAVAKAQGDKQIAAVNDSIPIMNDQHAILVDIKNGNTLQLQIDRQQLLIDRTTAQMDQVVGQMQVTIALDGLKAAQDKMMVDQMNASAAYVVAVDNLTLAQDAVMLAEAEQQLGIDQLTVLNNIDTTLGSVTDYLNLIDSDLQNLQSAQDQQQSDQLQLANDTADQSYVNLAGQGILAGDTLGQAGDQAALQQQQQAYELQIAQYKVQLNAFQLQQQDSQTNGQSVAALQAMVKTLQAMLTTVHSPAGRAIQAAGVGANSWAALQSGWNSTQIPMGFS